MKPEWCPSEVWEKARNLLDRTHWDGSSTVDRVARAILEAEQRGRREGMEEAVALALNRSPDDDNLDWQVRQQVAAAIRSKYTNSREPGEFGGGVTVRTR